MSQFIHLHFSDSFTWSWGSAFSASLSQLTLTHDENPAHKALKQCHLFICKWYTLGHQWGKFLFLCILLHMVREIRERRWGTLYYAEFQKKIIIITPETWQWKETVITFPTFSFFNSFYGNKSIFQEKKVFEYLFPSSPKF